MWFKIWVPFKNDEKYEHRLNSTALSTKQPGWISIMFHEKKNTSIGHFDFSQWKSDTRPVNKIHFNQNSIHVDDRISSSSLLPLLVRFFSPHFMNNILIYDFSFDSYCVCECHFWHSEWQVFNNLKGILYFYLN